MSDLNAEFWKIVGDPVPVGTWKDFEVGEVFLLEHGPLRQIMKVVRMNEDSFDCELAFGEELKPGYRIYIIVPEEK